MGVRELSPTGVTPEVLAEVLEIVDWTFAKTMPHNPHDYTLRRNWAAATTGHLFNESGDPIQYPTFDVAVQALRDYSDTVMFGGAPYQQFAANGWFYWTMGAPIHEPGEPEDGRRKTILINRKRYRAEREAALVASMPGDMPVVRRWYDQMAARYDGAYDPATSCLPCAAENQAIADIIAPMAERASVIIDLGCGTGLFLDMFPHLEHKYRGFDLSREMLRVAVQKHPGAQFEMCNAKEVWIRDPDALVVSLFGSPSYFPHGALDRWENRSHVWMHYADGYKPAYAGEPGYRTTTHTPPPKGAMVMFDKYAVTVNDRHASEVAA